MRHSQRVFSGAAALLLIGFPVPPSASAQTNYTAQNFNTNAGYKRGFGVTATNQPESLRWQGNDPYRTIASNNVGQTDVIQRASGYTPSPLANSSLMQGGKDARTGILPGTNKVRIWKTFSPPTAESGVFFAEWSLIPSSSLDAPYTNSDTFAFDLRNAANTQSLLTLQFTPGISIQTNSYTLQTLAAGSPVQTIVDLSYRALFQVTVAMTGSDWNLSLAQINSTNRAVINNYTNLASGNLATGTTALDFATLGLNWDLASTNNLEPGSNYIIANQFTVVPEPKTWALLAMGALLISAFAFRRHAI